jgi:hypothetical protein
MRRMTMREVQLLVGGAVLTAPFAAVGWLEAWPVGACATIVMVLYGVCGWLALRARRSWQAEVAEARRRKRADVALSGSWPRNVRVLGGAPAEAGPPWIDWTMAAPEEHEQEIGLPPLDDEVGRDLLEELFNELREANRRGPR